MDASARIPRVARVFALVLAAALLLPRPAAGQLYLDSQFGVNVTSGIVYGTGQTGAGSFNLLLDLYQPTGAEVPDPRPGVVLIHGGGFTGGSRTNGNLVNMANGLAERGYLVVSIDYRLLGQSPVPTPPFHLLGIASAATEDAVTAYEWLLSNAVGLGLDTDRMAIGGSSAGGITSVNAAYPLNDIGFGALPGLRAVVNLWGSIQFQPGSIQEGEPPAITVHGDADGTVSVAFSQALVADLNAAGIPNEYHEVAGAGHGFGATGYFTTEVLPGQTPWDRTVLFLFDHVASVAPQAVPATSPAAAAVLCALLLLGAAAIVRRRSRTPLG